MSEQTRERRPGAKVPLAALLLVLWASACISFRTQAPLPPDNQVESVQFCRDVRPEAGLLAPVGAASEFTSGDEAVCCFVTLKSVGQDIWLRWKWYAPAGDMAWDSGEVPVLTGGAFLEVVTAYDRLELTEELMDREGSRGVWTVVFYIDGRLAARGSFLLRGERPSLPSPKGHAATRP